MVIYANPGSRTPSSALSFSYVNASGPIALDAQGYVPLNNGCSILIKLDISDYAYTLLSVAKAVIRLPIMSPAADLSIRLYENEETDHNLQKHTSYRGVWIDTARIERKTPTEAVYVEFDVSAYLRGKLNSYSKTLYFKAVLDGGSIKAFKVLSGSEEETSSFSLALIAPKGLERFGAYKEFPNNAAGSSFVDLRTGKLIHEVMAITTNSPLIPLSLSLFHRDGKWVLSSSLELKEIDSSTYDLIDPTGNEVRYCKTTKEEVEKLYGPSRITVDGHYYLSTVNSAYLVVGVATRPLDYLVSLDGTVMVFSRSDVQNMRLESIEYPDGRRILYKGNGLLGPSEISSSDNEKILISYIGPSKPREMTSYDQRGNIIKKTTFSWNGNDLTGLSFFLGDSNLKVGEASFSYDDGRLAETKDLGKGTITTIGYMANNNVSSLSSGTIRETKRLKTSFQYGNRTTAVIYPNRQRDVLFFDNYGRLIQKLGREDAIETRNYKRFKDGRDGELSFVSSPIETARNLVDNGSFEREDPNFLAPWVIAEGMAEQASFASFGIHGRKCLRIAKGTEPFKIRKVIPNPSYNIPCFFSAYLKGEGTISPNDVKISLKVTGTQTVVIDMIERELPYAATYEIKNGENGDFPWLFDQKEVRALDNVKNVTTTLEIELAGEGYVAYFDGIALSKTERPASYNLLLDGHFEKETESPWAFEGLEEGDGVIPLKSGIPTPFFEEKRFLFLNGDILVKKMAVQEISLKGQPLDEVRLTAFLYGKLGLNDEVGVSLKYHYLDGEESEEKEALFQEDVPFWQGVSCSLAAKKAFDKVIVTLFSESGKGVYFGNVSLSYGTSGSSYLYDERRELTSETGKNGSLHEISYGENGKVIETIDENGETSIASYNEDGWLSLIQDGRGLRHSFAYLDGNMVNESFVSVNGEIIEVSSAYDYRRNVLTRTDEDQNVTSFSYDGYGRLESLTEPTGLLIQNAYNAKGLLSKEARANGSYNNETTYEYHEDESLKRLITNRASQYDFIHDDGNRLLEVKLNGSSFIKREYEEEEDGTNLGLVSKEIIGSLGDYREYGYDKKKRLSSIKANGNEEARFSYDSLSRLSSVTDLENGTEELVSYDEMGNVSSRRFLGERDDEFSYCRMGTIKVSRLNEKAQGLRSSVDYVYPEELSALTPSGFFVRLARASLNESIRGVAGRFPLAENAHLKIRPNLIS